MKETYICIGTGLLHNETVMDLRRHCGNEGVLALLRLWSIAAEFDKSGRLSRAFIEDLRRNDPSFVRFLLENNLLKETDDGYQIVFGLVHFEEPKQD